MLVLALFLHAACLRCQSEFFEAATVAEDMLLVYGRQPPCTARAELMRTDRSLGSQLCRHWTVFFLLPAYAALLNSLGGRLAPISNWNSIMGLYRGPGLGNVGCDVGAMFEHGEGRFVCETQGN